VEPACPFDAPLIVLAHGGPAAGFVHSTSLAADHTRYPIRHVLQAGFRVFMPMFRGTLGFGDAWAQANIGSQGALDSDLGDILAGLDWLRDHHPQLKGNICPSRTGIFGGSYGGYMTIRAMSEVPERFAAGIALYGFVHNRWMTYEGGDFTYEDEYIIPPPDLAGFEIEMVQEDAEHKKNAETRAPNEVAASASGAIDFTPARDRCGSNASVASASASDVWPLPRQMENSDSFNGLHRISAPLLLMHGEKDDICPLSQSQVAFHMLEKKGVPTGLIVYPGEGHGFDDPAHQRDRDRRMLAWWLEHISSK